MKLLEGKTAIITGASRGIGMAIAMKFAQNGANIAFTDLARDENMISVERDLRQPVLKQKVMPQMQAHMRHLKKLLMIF